MSNEDGRPAEAVDDASSREQFLSKVYGEICTNIRTSDDISFKLLGFVPLISSSGAAILSVAKIAASANSVAIISISLTAVAITFGLFKWELRNIQKCDWLIRRAADLEFLQSHPKRLAEPQIVISQFYGWEPLKKPPLFGRLPELPEPIAPIEQGKSKEELKPESNHWYQRTVAKTQAERIVYWASMLAWFVPIVISMI